MRRKTAMRVAAWALAIVTALGGLPLPGASPAPAAAASETWFEDDFDSPALAQERWKEVPGQWDVKTEDGVSFFHGFHANTRTFLRLEEAAGWTDYEVNVRARFDANVTGRAEFFVRADDSGNFYSVEAQLTQDGASAATFKIHRWAGTVYQGNLTANVTHAYDPTQWHDYTVTVEGSTISLRLDGEPIISATDPNSHYPSGGIGFRSQNVGLQIDRVAVSGEGGPAQELQIHHSPITEADAGQGIDISADIVGPASVTATVYYRYGHADEGRNFESASMSKGSGDSHSVRLPAPPSGDEDTLNYYIEASDAAGSRKSTGYADDFADAARTAEHWTKTPEEWIVADDGDERVMKATAGNTRNYLTGAGSETWTDYDVEFRAKFARKANGRGEFFVRANDQGDYYAVEAQTSEGTNDVLLKIHYWDNTVYQQNLTANVNATFDASAWNDYRIEVRGNRIAFYVNGTGLISATDSNNRYPSGGIGFRSNNVDLEIADLTVSHPVKLTASGPLAVEHSPVASVPYNADIPVAFTVRGDAGSAVTAAVRYRYGDEPEREVAAARGTDGIYRATIPGTNRSSAVGYHIAVRDEAGNAARYPASGDASVAVGAFEPYANDFESLAVGSVPAGWTVRGDAKIAALPEGGKALRLNGRVGTVYPSATLSNPAYGSIDNFILKFRAKYVRTSDEYYNVWRLRYRTQNDNNNYSMEWGTHNWRYFIMRKTDLGGNYYLGTYNEALDNRWVDYEIRASGITHELYIDGEKVIGVDDFDTLRMDKGYIQFGTVNGIELLIDSFEIVPLEPEHIYNVEPAGNYTGIYGPGEAPGLNVFVSGGAEAHTYKVAYKVRRADGERELVASGEREYELAAYGELNEELTFEPGIGDIGTYDVEVELYVDGVRSDASTKTMRMAVVREIPETPEIDADIESKFGFNTHYKENWRDDMMDAVRKTGARHHRSTLNIADSFTGQYGADGKPVFDFAKTDAYLNKIASFGLNSIPVFGVIEDTATAASYEGLRLLERFAYESANRYRGLIRTFETSNEPELFVDPYIPYEIVQQWKRLYLGTKKANPGSALIAGGHTSSVRSVLPRELELGAYNFADAFSWHPYVYNAMPDGAIESFVDDIGGMIDAYGGWKDFYLTEGGWPTAKGGYPNVSEEVQRDYIARAFLIYMTEPKVRAWEYYNFKNDGTDENYYEIFWGITDVDGRPKLAYGAVNNLMTTLAGAAYAGRLEVPDGKVRAYVFLKDGKPIIAAWRSVDHKDDPASNPATSQLAIDVGTDEVVVRSIEGRDRTVAATNGQAEVTVSGSPIFILNASADALYEAAIALQGDYREDAAGKIAKLETADNAAAVAELLGRLEGIGKRLETAMREPALADKAAGLEQGIGSLYGLMSDMASAIEAGQAERKQAFVAMEALYHYAEAAAQALIQAKSEQGAGAGSAVPDYAAAVAAARSALEARAGDDYVLPVGNAAVMRAERYGRLAENNRERGADAASYAYGLLAREFAAVALRMTAADAPVYVGAWLNVTPVKRNAEAGYASELTGTVANDTAESVSAAVRIVPPEGWGEAETLTATIAPGETYRFEHTLAIPADAPEGVYEPKVELVVGGAVVDEAAIELTVESAIAAGILPIGKPIAELDEIQVRLHGRSAAPKSGKVTVYGPDGEPLAPVSGDTFADLGKDETVTLAFRWDYREARDFNEYSNRITVTESASGRVIFDDAQVPLDFLLIEKTGTVAVDGRLDDWTAAYPVHLRGAGRNNTGVYDPGNLDATAYAMWDDGHLYLAAKVSDDIHKNSEDAANMWKNDSLQFAIDPLADSPAAYNQDDMEWGFARHDDGRLLANIFFSRPPNPNGSAGELLPFAIARDEEAKETTYEIKIPRGLIHGLALAEGTKLGMNYAVNDADFQMGRDNFIQWTRGLADGKNPGGYDRFALADTAEDPDPVSGTSIALAADKPIVEVGENVAVTVAAEEADDLYAVELTFRYDPSLFRLNRAELAEAFAPGGDGYLRYEDDGGTVRVAASRTGAVPGAFGSADLIRLEFAALSEDGAADFAVPGPVAVSNSGGQAAVVPQGGELRVAVADTAAVTGGKPNPKAIETIARSFGKREGETGYKAVYDMNKDGIIDIIDLAYVASRYLRS